MLDSIYHMTQNILLPLIHKVTFAIYTQGCHGYHFVTLPNLQYTSVLLIFIHVHDIITLSQLHTVKHICLASIFI